MILIMDRREPETFVLATGKNASVRDFVEMAFAAIGVELGGTDAGSMKKAFAEKPAKFGQGQSGFFRPAEVDALIGDARVHERLLGWKAHTSLEELCRLMVEADIRRNEIGCSF